MAATTVSLGSVSSPIPMTSSTTSSTGTFDESASDFIAKNRGKLLIETIAKDHLGRGSVYISGRESGERGFGTSSTRFVFKTSLECGYGGRFHNIVAMSSHLFHLYMGMIPVDEEVSHVCLYWGARGEKILKQVDDIITALEIHKPLESTEESHLTVLKEILSNELLSKLALVDKISHFCAGFSKNFERMCKHMLEKFCEKDAKKENFSN